MKPGLLTLLPVYIPEEYNRKVVLWNFDGSNESWENGARPSVVIINFDYRKARIK
jgi:hypothetical protein